MALVNNGTEPLVCPRCDEVIEVGDHCYREGGDIICECCHEDLHEYDNE